MLNKTYDLKFSNWLKDNKERILSQWIELVKIPSIKASASEGAPFGKSCADALEYAASLFSADKITCSCFTQRGYALAEYGNGQKKIGLFSHSDVVPVGEDWLYTEAFTPIIKDGALIGRGVEDNKSGIIASLCIMEFLSENNIPLKSTLSAFIGSDEECGMKDMESYLAYEKIPDVSIVPDADFPCSTGEKGICHFWCSCEDKLRQIISLEGGEAFNIVLDKVITKIRYSPELFSELSDKLKNKDEFTIEKNEDTVCICAKGIAKHASIPDGSVNAAFLTAELLSDCSSLCDNDRIIMNKVMNILSSPYGESLNVSHTDKNFGRTTTVNGRVMTENGIISLSFDCRYADSYDGELLVRNSEKALNAYGFKLRDLDNSPGFSIDKNSEITRALVEIYNEATGQSLDSVLMSGGTYARKLKNAFSVGTSIIKDDRKDKVLKMPDGHGGPHQCDEMIDIEGFFEAVRVIFQYVIACDDIINR